MTERPPAALLLDLDGTLIDTLPAMRAAYAAFLVEHGATPSDGEFERLNGPSLAEIVADLRMRHGLPGPEEGLHARYRALIAERYAPAARLTPGARVLIEAAAHLGVPVAVVTSAERALAEATLARLGLVPSIAVVVTGDDVPQAKPHPAIYTRALAALGVRAEQAWAVEDSVNGLRAAIAAGVRVFAVGQPAPLPPGVRPLRSLAHLAALLQCDVEPLPAGVVVMAPEGVAAYGPALEAAVDAAWADAVIERPGRHDGTLLGYEGRDGATIRGRFVRYRHYFAQRRDPALARALAITPLAVSGVLRAGETVALGRRAAHMAQYPGWLELVPSGGIEASRRRPDGTVDVEAQLLAELVEETGVGGEAVRGVAALALVRDRVDPVVDLAAVIDVAPGTPLDGTRTGEYAELRWAAIAELPRLLDEVGEIVPASRALAELISGGRPHLVE